MYNTILVSAIPSNLVTAILTSVGVPVVIYLLEVTGFLGLIPQQSILVSLILLLKLSYWFLSYLSFIQIPVYSIKGLLTIFMYY